MHLYHHEADHEVQLELLRSSRILHVLDGPPASQHSLHRLKTHTEASGNRLADLCMLALIMILDQGSAVVRATLSTEPICSHSLSNPFVPRVGPRRP